MIEQLALMVVRPFDEAATGATAATATACNTGGMSEDLRKDCREREESVHVKVGREKDHSRKGRKRQKSPFT